MLTQCRDAIVTFTRFGRTEGWSREEIDAVVQAKIKHGDAVSIFKQYALAEGWTQEQITQAITDNVIEMVKDLI